MEFPPEILGEIIFWADRATTRAFARTSRTIFWMVFEISRRRGHIYAEIHHRLGYNIFSIAGLVYSEKYVRNEFKFNVVFFGSPDVFCFSRQSGGHLYLYDYRATKYEVEIDHGIDFGRVESGGIWAFDKYWSIYVNLDINQVIRKGIQDIRVALKKYWPERVTFSTTNGDVYFYETGPDLTEVTLTTKLCAQIWKTDYMTLIARKFADTELRPESWGPA